MLNKPTGYVSARVDKLDRTILDLVPDIYLHRNLFPVGRLDKDTTGLMIITDDGDFAHDVLSPKKHIPKTYMVTIDIPLTEEMILGFKNGVELNDGICKPSILEITGEYTAKVTLTEGRYHQIKRMFGCYKAKVLKLHRIKMGNFTLPNNLKVGECREFTKEELKKVQE
jgi:16S rRNA pseudouridine516 synthase